MFSKLLEILVISILFSSIRTNHWIRQLGQRQSPINIITSLSKYASFKSIRNVGTNHGLHTMIISNYGQSVKIEPVDDSEVVIISRGPMENYQYKFAEIHFHWGENDNIGSETQINGEVFPLESHVVFYNTKFSNYSVARDMANGLVVMSVLFDISSINNPIFSFTSKLDQISEYGTTMKYDFMGRRYTSFLPNRSNSYYTYRGSLTTPPYSESVTWIVFIDRMRISSAQLKNFRLIRDENGERVLNNFREVQPLNDRIVYSSRRKK